MRGTSLPSFTVPTKEHAVNLEDRHWDRILVDLDREEEQCELPPGSLLKPLSELDDPRIIANLKLRSRKSCDVQLCRDVLQSSLLLLAIEEPSERISLYRDLEVFDFIRGLKIGDEVLVEIGKNWTMNGSEWESPSRTVYAAASQIHKPTRNSTASVNSNRISIIPDARVVPIQRLDTCFQSVSLTEPSVSEIFTREMKAWGGDLRPLDQKDHECEGSRDRRRTRLPMQNVKTATQPSRSHSSHSVSIYEKTFSVDDIVRTKGAKVGDRCDWKDGKQSHKGTIKFLGHLKGHASLYAGIDFVSFTFDLFS
uniref:CAP-Gly domain-containing protein n=1 Tax=Heterorhabditis bacteriophora TaxID=37862 RepID=A0A1I7XJ87_HETBA